MNPRPGVLAVRSKNKEVGEFGDPIPLSLTEPSSRTRGLLAATCRLAGRPVRANLSSSQPCQLFDSL
jgi:hypothetical protein